MTYKCTHFIIQELVPEHVFIDRGEKAWTLFDDRILRVADLLRDEFGPATVNNWHIGGDFEWSGLRTPEYEHYRPYSQHPYGRALDIKFSRASAEEVRQWIKVNRVLFEDWNIRVTLENGVAWLHVDVRNNTTAAVSSFNP